ncbi:MAG: amino-acid N-acetyltransferase [Verrucomicrobia bacterium]|nr:amino-acid N-acetyltransferase [Verrucomicrobiota bacterium]
MQFADLRGILQYVPRFRDRTFVIALDGEIAEAENFANLLLDLAVLRSLNIRIVLVHGARFQIARLAGEAGVPLSNNDGSGVTDATTLRVVLDASTRLTHEIMEGLSSVDLRAAVVNAVTAYPLGIIGGVDHEFTGRVDRIDAETLQMLLERGLVPVLPPLGFDGEGRSYRVNSDAVAVEVALALKAAKIIFLCESGSLEDHGQLVRQLSVSEAEEALKQRRGTLPRNLELKLDWAARACREGIARVHLLDGHQNEALLAEVFSNEGVGTMIHSNDYQMIRRAQKRDARRILALIRQSVEDDALVKRTRNDILAQIEDYYVLEVDRNIVGCIALHPFPEDGMAELACMYVARTNENAGYGRRLMAFVEALAREKGFSKMFALSTQAFVFLQQRGGFQEATPEDLPKARREKYEASGRRSRVLIKSLAPAASRT